MPPFTPTGETRARVYRYVRQCLERGRPPTVREVQGEFGFRAVETARKHLERLVEEGLLDKRVGTARGYCLPVGEDVPSVLVPLVGRVAAGGLSEAIENREGSVPVEGTSADGLFAVRVEGESMIGVGILPGDIAIVRTQPAARSGDIVVALVDGEATIKTLRRTGRRVQLCPENPAFDPIVPLPSRLTILGKVIEVRRYLDRR
jgi:repressor LexA